MKFFADILLLLAAAIGGDSAASDRDSTIDERVIQLVAAEWRVDPSAVRLSWGTAKPVVDQIGIPVKISGRGRNGWFAVIVDPMGRGAAAQVRAGVLASVPVATRRLTPGSVLEETDITVEIRTRWGPPSDSLISAGPGWVVRRPVASGELLSPPAVVPPVVVTRGSPVKLVWSGREMSVTIDGEALNSGRIGESLRVRVPGRSNIMRAIVTGPGTGRLLP